MLCFNSSFEILVWIQGLEKMAPIIGSRLELRIGESVLCVGGMILVITAVLLYIF